MTFSDFEDHDQPTELTWLDILILFVSVAFASAGIYSIFIGIGWLIH